MQSLRAWSEVSQQQQDALETNLVAIKASLQSSACDCQSRLDQLQHWQQHAEPSEQQHVLSQQLQEAKQQLVQCRQAVIKATQEVDRVTQQQDAFLKQREADAATPAGTAWNFGTEILQAPPDSASELLLGELSSSSSSPEASDWYETSSSDTSADEATSSDGGQTDRTFALKSSGGYGNQDQGNSLRSINRQQALSKAKGYSGRNRGVDTGPRTASTALRGVRQGQGQERQGQLWQPDGGASSSSIATWPARRVKLPPARDSVVSIHHK